jgi:hypothetical protein
VQAQVRLEEGQNRGATISFTPDALAAPQPAPQNPSQPIRNDLPASRQPLIFQWFSGGFLSSLICYFVYGYPLSYVWQEVWPPGLLDFLGLAALCYLGYRCYLKLSQDQKSEIEAPPEFLRLGRAAPPPITVVEEAKPGLAAIQESDSNFDLQAFGEEIRLLLAELYEAWNREDLQSLNGKVKESLLEYLQMALKLMFLREESSYLEDLTLDGIAVTAAGVHDGRDFITVRLHGRLLDYVLDKTSGKLLLGSMAYPATFQEYWDLERPRGQSAWVIHDIRES